MKGVTTYQLGVLKAVAAAPAGQPLDLDQMIEQLSWAPSKESTQFVIRSLIQKGFLAKTDLVLRRGRRRVCYQLTASGAHLLDPRGPVCEDLKPVPGESADPDDGVKMLTDPGGPDVKMLTDPGASSVKMLTPGPDFDRDFGEFIEG